MPRQEPVRPIDPGAWVAHTAAVRGKNPINDQTFTVNGVRERILMICFRGYMLIETLIKPTLNTQILN